MFQGEEFHVRARRSKSAADSPGYPRHMANSLEPSHLGGSDPSAHTNWRWRLEDSSGAEVASGLAGSQGFPSQSDAESWVGEVWRDLLDDGVDAVTLFEGERKVYGPMSLRAGD
jgi:hypothetical protein